jgi:hypothetical protein
MSEFEHDDSAAREFDAHIAKQRKSVVLMVSVIFIAVGALMAMRYLPPGETGAGPIEPQGPWELPPIGPTDPAIEILTMAPPTTSRETPRDPFPRQPDRPQPPTSAESRLRDIEQAAEQIPLQAIMSGKAPVARVNGKVVRPGMIVRVTLDGTKLPVDFKVDAISDSGVVLVVEEPQHDVKFETTLRMKR